MKINKILFCILFLSITLFSVEIEDVYNFDDTKSKNDYNANKTTITSTETLGGYGSLDKEFTDNFSIKLDNAFKYEGSAFSNAYNNTYNSRQSDAELEEATENRIKKNLNDYLVDTLTDDTYKSKEFSKKINDTFLEVTKEESINYINNDEVLSAEQKSNLIDSVTSKNDLESLTSFFDEVEVWIEVDDGDAGTTKQKWSGTEDLASNSENSETANEQTNYSFDCQCDDALEDAFEKMYKHLITNNLEKIPSNIENLIAELEAQIEETNNQTESITNKKKIYIQRLLEARVYLAKVKKEAEMLKRKEIK